MRKIITIAESVLDTVYDNGQPQHTFVGGRIPCAAASLAQTGAETLMVSECTTDVVGDIIIDYLSRHKVDVSIVDRYPDGATAFSAIFKQDGKTTSIVNYGSYPEERFKVVWPRINRDDIVVIGSLYAVDLPQRERLFEMVSYAVERGAIIVNLPGFQHGTKRRITHLMPHLLENLEVSNIVITQEQDIHTIFPGETSQEVYAEHVGFYCDNYLHLAGDTSVEHYHNGKCKRYPDTAAHNDNWLGWQAGFTAGVVFSLLAQNITRQNIDALTDEQWNTLIEEARQWAQASTGADNCVSAEWAATRSEALQRGLQAYENENNEGVKE